MGDASTCYECAFANPLPPGYTVFGVLSEFGRTFHWCFQPDYPDNLDFVFGDDVKERRIAWRQAWADYRAKRKEPPR